MRRLAVLDAPSNLGLRPPEPGAVPGVYKLAGAIRDTGFVARLGARDAGVVTPPRYRSEWDGRTVRNLAAIARYSRTLADRVGQLVHGGEFPLVLGGDCSILVGNALALRRLGRHGLVFLDGHLDFRHLGNAEAVGAAAGEDLALVTGRGDPALTDPDGLAPLVDAGDVVAVGFRASDEYAAETGAAGIELVSADAVRAGGAAAAGRRVAGLLEERELDGFWIHLDADVLDAEVMPAVDSPEPGGLSFDELTDLLRPLLASPLAAGLELTIFDPDLDEDGKLAAALSTALEAAFHDSG